MYFRPRPSLLWGTVNVLLAAKHPSCEAQAGRGLPSALGAVSSPGGGFGHGVCHVLLEAAVVSLQCLDLNRKAAFFLIFKVNQHWTNPVT